MGKKYNKIFQKLVKDEDDFVGMVAYAIYKKNKIEHLEKFEKEKGRVPTDLDLESFCYTSCLDTTIDNYKTKAFGFILRFYNNLMENELKEIKNEYEQKLAKSEGAHSAEIEKIKNEYEENLAKSDQTYKVEIEKVNSDLAGKMRLLEAPSFGKQFWSGVSQSIVAAFIIFIFGIFLLIASWGEKHGGVTGALRNMANHIFERSAASGE